MRRVAILLSALTFVFAMNGEAMAKDPKPKAKTSDADKAAMKEKAAQHAADLKDKKNDDKGGTPLMHFHAGTSHSKSDSNWLHDKGSKLF